MIQLDTSFLIKALITGSPEDEKLRQWLRRREALSMSSLAWTEFLCGPVGATAGDSARRLVGEPLPFTAVEGERAATLFNETGRRRGSLVDCMIAAMAIEAGDRLATSNPDDFSRFVRLGLEIV